MEIERPGALGVVEVSSIARGVQAADAMLKRSRVALVIGRPICPGKFLTVVSGPVADVRDAVETGRGVAAEAVVDSLVLAGPHPALVPALTQATEVAGGPALGMVECFTMCAALAAADQAVKRAAVDLVEIRLAIMMAGKAYVTFVGDEAAVQTAVDDAAGAAGREGLLVSAVVIPRLQPELWPVLL